MPLITPYYLEKRERGKGKKGYPMDFKQLFKQISPEELGGAFNVFTLMGFFLVTAGKIEHYNSMVCSGGAIGLHFKKPAVWCIFQSARYTLELIQKEKTYTLSWFPDEYKKQLLFLGSKSGRDSEKMKEIKLTSIQTPCANMSFEEAKLIIECSLTQITTANADDFYSQESKDYLKEAYKDPKEIRKYVFGQITNIWIKK
ncbi:MAG: hypothetical protein LBV16_03440 [Elusimicrobiota bacterium]|jgi:hypothetical protein|nr:hypothetical protein [Elusimicrobiota bacterium]